MKNEKLYEGERLWRRKSYEGENVYEGEKFMKEKELYEGEKVIKEKNICEVASVHALFISSSSHISTKIVLSFISIL
jgi:hypothetical protein